MRISEFTSVMMKFSVDSVYYTPYCSDCLRFMVAPSMCLSHSHVSYGIPKLQYADVISFWGVNNHAHLHLVASQLVLVSNA